jgi:hypothetical protein
MRFSFKNMKGSDKNVYARERDPSFFTVFHENVHAASTASFLFNPPVPVEVG